MNKENISAFTDGHFNKQDFELLIQQVEDSEGQVSWDLYHQIGDAMRMESHVNPVSKEFALRFAVAFAAEPELTPLRFAWLEYGPLALVWHAGKSVGKALHRILPLKTVGRFLHLS